jgi:hypothetical protein
MKIKKGHEVYVTLRQLVLQANFNLKASCSGGIKIAFHNDAPLFVNIPISIGLNFGTTSINNFFKKIEKKLITPTT